LLNQIIRKFGTKDSGGKHLREFYETVLRLIADGVAVTDIPARMVQIGRIFLSAARRVSL
jgi:hypothetical protein